MERGWGRTLPVLRTGQGAATHCGGGNGDDHGVVGIFRRLGLPDAAVMGVVAIVMGKTLASGSAAVEAVGLHVGVDMADWWRADGTFLDLIRDRQVLAAMVGEVAGPEVASANAGEKGRALRQIVRDCLDGTNGRARVEHWVPRWLAFPPSAYTERGGGGAVRAHAKAVAAFVEPEVGNPAPQETLPDEVAGVKRGARAKPDRLAA